MAELLGLHAATLRTDRMLAGVADKIHDHHANRADVLAKRIGAPGARGDDLEEDYLESLFERDIAARYVTPSEGAELVSKAHYERVWKRRRDGVEQRYRVKMLDVEEINDRISIGTQVRVRTRDGRPRLLTKVADLHPTIVELAGARTRGVWYDQEALDIDRDKHGAILKNPLLIVRRMLEELSPETSIIQTNDVPEVLRFYRTLNSLGDLVAQHRRLNYVYLVVAFNLPGGRHAYNFVKSLYYKRAIMQDRRRLWP
jgi:hypothetical protein